MKTSKITTMKKRAKHNLLDDILALIQNLSVLLIILIGSATLVLAHGDEDHKKKKDTTKIETEAEKETKVSKEIHEHEHAGTTEHAHGTHSDKKTGLKASFDDFPTLHPLVVHFPIVLLLLAMLTQIASLFVFKNELSWVTIFLVSGGFIGAYVAGNYVHPHTVELDNPAAKILVEHEDYANYTLWLSGIAAVLKLLSHFLLKRKLWGEITVAIILIAATYCVSTAGHYGAQLIHIEGIGAKGEYLESHKDDHQH